MKLPPMTTPDSITQGLMQFNHNVSEHCCKADVDGQLGERTKIIALMHISPNDFTDKVILDDVKVDCVADLESRRTASKMAHRELDVIPLHRWSCARLLMRSGPQNASTTKSLRWRAR